MAAILFPDFDALRLALASGALPPTVTLSPTRFGADDQGRLWLEPTRPLPRSAIAALNRFGARVQGTSAAPLLESAERWPLVLPLRPVTAAPSAPVLFELPAPEGLLPLIAELRRLGAGRIGWRLAADAQPPRLLVQVDRAPLATLLRAADRSLAQLRAFVPAGPRVWVELGYEHPLPSLVAPPEGQIALVAAPRDWIRLTDAPMAFGPPSLPLPMTTPVADSVVDWRMDVDLRLVPHSVDDAAELWVLIGPARAQFDALVEQTDDRMLRRLTVAAAYSGGEPALVVRATPDRGPAPIVLLDAALACRPIARLPNLFAPCGWRIQPALRRDVLRSRFAADPDWLVWLQPTGDGQFIPHRLEWAAFRPVTECVEYRLGHAEQALEPEASPPVLPLTEFTVHSARRPPAPRSPRAEAAGGTKSAAAPADGWLQRLVRWMTPLFSRPEATEPAPAPAADSAPPTPLPVPADAAERLRALEVRLLTSGSHEENRRQLWENLAQEYAAQQQPGEAAACWLHVLWDDDTTDPSAAAAWLAAEARGQAPADSLQRWLTGPPTPSTIRALAAFVVWADAQDSPPTECVPALERIQQRLETHGTWLPVRAAWLAQRALSRLTAGDLVGLSRSRDQLLDRLFQHGLSADLDVPAFLRFAGQVTGDRRQGVRDWLQRQREPMHRWIAQAASGGADLRLPQYGLGATPRFNRAYVDLILAWGMARLGERPASHDLAAQARAALDLNDPVHAVLADAFVYRAEQSLTGAAHAGPLPPDFAARLAALADREAAETADVQHQWIYKIERMREASRILEPDERVRAFEEGHLDYRLGGRSGLRAITDPSVLTARLAQMLDRPATPESLAIVLDLAPRVGETLAVETLSRLLAEAERWNYSEPLEAYAAALERAWFVATRFDRGEAARRLVAELERLLLAPAATSIPDSVTSDVVAALVQTVWRSLRRLGLVAETHHLIETLRVWANAPLPRPRALRRRLLLAVGWLSVGQDAPAISALDDARLALFTESMSARDRTELACGYAAALGSGPVRLTLGRIEELFQRLNGISDQLSTNSHFSLSRLRVVEAAVLAVVNDDFALGPVVRRWLDDDEFRVRQRIHRDMHAAMQANSAENPTADSKPR